jgi:hypothetical protein
VGAASVWNASTAPAGSCCSRFLEDVRAVVTTVCCPGAAIFVLFRWIDDPFAFCLI